MGDKSGFTLLEVLVAVLIITILATLVGVNIAREPGKARVAAAKAQIATIRTALEMYRMHNGRIPTEAQGLDALCVKPTIAPIPAMYQEGGYLNSSEVPLDPWGGDYVYLSPGSRGGRYEVISYGGDSEPGGDGEDADISSSDR